MTDERTPWLQTLWRALTSGRLAVALLALYVVWYLFSLSFPQVEVASDAEVLAWIELNGGFGKLADAIGLTDIKRSWLLLTTHELLFINLVACMIKRVRPMVISSRRPTQVPPRTMFRSQRTIAPQHLAVADVLALLKRRRYVTLVEGQTVFGVRGRFAIVGHFVFHIGFVVLLIVGVSLSFADEPFRGTVGVGEGEPFALHTTPFLGSNLPIVDALSPLEFALKKLTVETSDGQTTAFEAVVTTSEGQHTVAVNRPLRQGPYQVVPQGFGFMPGWVLVRRNQMVAGAWIKLVPFPNEYRDVIHFGEEGAVEFVFLPHRVDDGESSHNASDELTNPYFMVQATWHGETVHSGWLAPGEKITMEPGLVFYYAPEVRHWVIFEVVEEQGQWGVFGSFGVILLGLFLRYVRIRKRVRVEFLEDGRVDVRGESEILESLFDEELGLLAEELAAIGGGEQAAEEAG